MHGVCFIQDIMSFTPSWLKKWLWYPENLDFYQDMWYTLNNPDFLHNFFSLWIKYIMIENGWDLFVLSFMAVRFEIYKTFHQPKFFNKLFLTYKVYLSKNIFSRFLSSELRRVYEVFQTWWLWMKELKRSHSFSIIRY